MLLHVESRINVPTALVTAAGEMDMSNAELVRTEVLLATADGCTDVTLDLSDVSFIDSMSLGMLVGCHKRLGEQGGELRVVTSNLTVLRMLAISRLDELLTVIDTGVPEEPVA